MGKAYSRKAIKYALILLLGIAVCGGCNQKSEVAKVTETPVPTTIVLQTVTPTEVPAVIEATPTVTDTPAPTATSTPTPTDTPTPTPNSLTITMAGDVLLHTRIEKDCRMEDGSYDYSGIFANMKEYIESFDLAIVNQEVIIGGAELGVDGYPRFNAGYELAAALVDAGFDLTLHGTNHVLDKGKEGLVNCLENWKNYPEMAILGAYLTEEEAENQIYIFEKNGIKVAVLNFCYAINGSRKVEDSPWMVGPLLTTGNEEKIVALIDRAEEMADFTIVCPHWGTEYSLTSSKSQRNWNKIFYEHGVDLVLGTHPHVIEPILIVEENDSNYNYQMGFDLEGDKSLRTDQMLVYYSIGNFVNWTEVDDNAVYNRMVGGMPEVTLSRNEEGEVYIKDFDVTAIVSHVKTGNRAVTVYKLSDYTEELALENEIKTQTNLFSLENLHALCDEVWGKYWK